MKLDTSDADRFYRALGKSFKDFRLAYGKTVEEIARVINVSPGQYERKEGGETCSVRDFMAIIQAIGVNAAAVLEDDEELEVGKITPETPPHQGTEYLLPSVPRPPFLQAVPAPTLNNWSRGWNNAVSYAAPQFSYSMEELNRAAVSILSPTPPPPPERNLTVQEEQILRAFHDKNSDALRTLALSWEVESWEAQNREEKEE